MKFKLLIIPSVLICQVIRAQSGPVTMGPPQGATTTVVSSASSTPAPPSGSGPAVISTMSTQASILDYKSVYEAPTIEEEVQMAAERFNLTPSQQEVWLTAATDRREVERQSRAMIDSKAQNYEKEGAYKGLRVAQNEFYETVIGYLNPAQKQAMETDRVIMQEKQKKLAKLPPPPPPVTTVTVAPVDSTLIKKEEKSKTSGKKTKKKKQAQAIVK